MSELKKGYICAISSYLVWGLAPIYFVAIKQVEPLEVLAHRVISSAVFLSLILIAQKRFSSTFSLLKSPRVVLSMLACTAFVLINWFTFIYAVSSGHTLESSFGYFILPLFSVAIGFFFLGERLTKTQFIALFFATLGIGYQMVLLGKIPWIALTLATSFAVYGLIRKQLQVGPIQGVFLETLFAMPLALLYLAYSLDRGELVFAQPGQGKTTLLLSLAGLVTFVPLWLFAAGAKRMTYSAMGFIQFICPSMHFLLAVFAFGESLSFQRLLSFGLVWFGLSLLCLMPLWRGQWARLKQYRLRWRRRQSGLPI
ncbi:MAG: EamA family transporter RarD [Bdellovibrionales bacterium]